MITDKMYYKMIDNLPFSIKPKNYDEFRRNLTKCLKKKLFPGNPKTLYEMLVECNMKKMRERGINVSYDWVKTHTIVEISLCYVQDVYEYDLDIPKEWDKDYMEVFMGPLMELYNEKQNMSN